MNIHQVWPTQALRLFLEAWQLFLKPLECISSHSKAPSKLTFVPHCPLSAAPGHSAKSFLPFQGSI